MKLYEKCFRIYGSIPENNAYRSRWKNSVFSAFRFCIRLLSTKVVFPLCYKCKRKEKLNSQDNLIVSLTSFPARLSTLWLTIESIKQQDLRPKKIILYLIEEEVSRDKVPMSLLAEEDELFEIRYRNIKMRAHGKYHYAMKDFPEDIIVTIDDDMIYPPYMLSTMMECYQKYPESVLTNQTTQIQLDEHGQLQSYNNWKWLFDKDYYEIDGCIRKERLLPLGVCGVLYPPHLLYKDVLNFDLAKQLSYLADDLWLYAMTILSHHRVVKTSLNSLDIMPIDIKNNITLFSKNGGENQNDKQFNQIRNYYKEKLGIDIVQP